MLRYLKRKLPPPQGDDISSSTMQKCPEMNLEDLPSNPGLRPRILDYHTNNQDQVHRAYLQRGPRQPLSHDFPRDAQFFLMVDEARDISLKEQMAMVIRFVNGKAHCYDGASNMRGQFNGLKVLIFNENPCAYYIHCFAHQLQLALVVLARKHDHISSLFDFIARVLNVVGSSCKWRDMLREKQAERIIKALKIGEIFSGQGLNQETNLQRSCDTHWGSHYNTLLSLIIMFAPVIDVLEFIGSDALITSHQTEAQDITDRLLSFGFIFSFFLMKKVLAITNELSHALQRKYQDIVNAMNLVKVSKLQLQVMRKSGWSSFLEDVSFFCNKHGIGVLDMDAIYVT
ncbi:zinc finger MYM-type protein 1-like [Tripterygium wilfordii]|uniref:zinc finger MYM-type protein 1-like n=1 Tax=Tripterygium wilfordii TaxID=458696 RepID=UPI0018F81745|nr:zinc finger MYM-type protein 1-like [Tripterygium wilfordii]